MLMMKILKLSNVINMRFVFRFSIRNLYIQFKGFILLDVKEFNSVCR